MQFLLRYSVYVVVCSFDVKIHLASIRIDQMFAKYGIVE